MRPTRKIVKLISIDIARKYKVLPLGKAGTSLQVAMVDPTNYRALDDLKFITGYNIEPLKGDEAAILEAIEYAYNAPEADAGGTEDLNQAMAAFGDDFDAEEGEEGESKKLRSPIWNRPPKSSPSSGWSTSCWPKPSRPAPATFTLSPTKRNTGCASAWTAFCRS